MDSLTRLILRADAVFDCAFGVLLFLSPWLKAVIAALQLPTPQPELYTQLGGGLLVTFAYLLWQASNNAALARPIALAVGAVNAVGVLLIAGWLISGQLGVGNLGNLILVAACFILVVFSVVELRYALISDKA